MFVIAVMAKLPTYIYGADLYRFLFIDLEWPLWAEVDLVCTPLEASFPLLDSGGFGGRKPWKTWSEATASIKYF
jgi:hypothetical protein